ncbi:contact-dependent growth inhibition system immunity protein [Streptomyces mirabilis]|uniref:contact-dependent growth inhibition system immunity protein n=1 Tax=Streptomyces mirabilis TaxID=68239 RepID=UPI00369562FB
MNLPDDYLLRDERFPELHELLDSYASAGWTFTDTSEAAGPALQAYVRQGIGTPGLLDVVIDEIDDLLQVGLFSDEIADDVDVLPQIEPPAGVTVEQCLTVIRTHLVRINKGGAYKQSALPQTDWEWRKQFPELGHLLAGYFHQDYSRFYASHREALDDYFTGNPREMFAATAREIDSFLSLIESDSELDRATQILGLMVYPPEGVSLRQWLTDIQGIITHRQRD